MLSYVLIKHGKNVSASQVQRGRKNKRPADSDGHYSISCSDAIASSTVWAGDRSATSVRGECDIHGLGDQQTAATASEGGKGNNSANSEMHYSMEHPKRQCYLPTWRVYAW